MFFDALLSYVSEDDLAILAGQAMDKLKEADPDLRRTGGAAAVVAYTSLQHPGALGPYLPEIWLYRPNARTYYESWPWRGAGAAAIDDLLRICSARAGPEEARIRAWRAILETRQEDTLLEAIRLAPSIGAELVATLDAHLSQVGYEARGNRLRRLAGLPVMHFRFPNGHFQDDGKPMWARRTVHPTWANTAPSVASCQIGGDTDVTCSQCHRQLLRFVYLEDGLDRLAITGRSRIELVACDVCVAYSSALFYAHDHSGAPRSLPVQRTLSQLEAFEWDPTPLAPVRVELVQTSPRWERQDWGLSNSRENLYRVGGEPTWIQSAEFPRCPRCHELMPFLLQMDSDLPQTSQGVWSCGAGSGIIYFFWCDACGVSAASIQDT